jgi:haloacetate dehalogenase
VTDFATAFEPLTIDTGEASIAVRRAGDGPPVLLLHGFPETMLMWRDVAPVLAEHHAVVCADLRGYGNSGCPPSDNDHTAYSKRAMARDMVAVMRQLGYGHFAIVGHDRGGRVAYRTALDHPEHVTRLVVLDVLPVDVVWDLADHRMALGFWPWSLLAQPEPLPERLLGGDPRAVVDNATSEEWGTPASVFDDEVREVYAEVLRHPEHVHAICEEYRAGAGIDREHDAVDRKAARRIRCPLLALWSGDGPLGSWYDDAGGPLALWRDLADDVTGGPVEGGHFFPEEHPDQTAEALLHFLG